MHSTKSVALFFETSNASPRGLLDGVLLHVQNHEPWSLYFVEQERSAPLPHWIARWKGDGIIARIESNDFA